MVAIFLIVIFTLLSGFADSQGFVHAAKIWQDDLFIWNEAAKSTLSFAIGIASYWVALRYIVQFGVISVEIQTLSWFLVTIVGIELISGEALQWRTVDKIIALLVVAGVAWLLFSVGE